MGDPPSPHSLAPVVNLDGLTATAAGSAGIGVALTHRLGGISLRRLEAFSNHVDRPETSSRAEISHWLAPMLLGISVAVFLGGFFGLAVGVVAVIALRRWLNSLPAASQVARQRDRRQELPVIVDLLAACLRAGATPIRAVEAVANAATSSLRGDLERIAAALRIGASPDEAWRLVPADLNQVANVMIRSARSGSPASDLLQRVGADLRATARFDALAEARRLGVRITGPLGLCFLPAFLLIGVVPLVMALVQAWI